ncbi:MAG: hypothetical protein HYY86_00145 [Candidatus Harrisonbacteria bacterium]|nr:hypothetical protein [Candidatus Harrisonbacteria bacterium]
MADENPVRQTTLEVLKKASEVRINKEKVEELAARWNQEGLPVAWWDCAKHFQSENEEQLLTYLILLDSLNFCFWNHGAEKWAVNLEGRPYSGYFALSLSLKEFFEKNPDKANLHYFEEVSFKEFSRILQWGKNLLYLEERWQIARRVSCHILKKYGSARNFILSSDQKLSVLIPKIAMELFSFSDHFWHNGQRIYFWKRAQILAMDIYGAFAGRGLGYFKDLDYPTAFPDYKLPQILNHYGIMEYSPALEALIKNRCLIYPMSKEEIKIRSATVWAVEYLKEALQKYGGQYHSFELDWILWEKSQKAKMNLPHHRTETIFY